MCIFSCNLYRNAISTSVLTVKNKLLYGYYREQRFDDHMRLKEHFHWLVPQTVVTQVAGQMLHCAILNTGSNQRL